MRIIGAFGLVAMLVAFSCAVTEADAVGIASTCSRDEDCPWVEVGGADIQLQCLTEFAGGYCSIPDCSSAADCPAGATCVHHDSGANYCFRACASKSECNANRPASHEANCSANFEYASSADASAGLKACIPPSGT